MARTHLAGRVVVITNRRVDWAPPSCASCGNATQAWPCWANHYLTFVGRFLRRIEEGVHRQLNRSRTPLHERSGGHHAQCHRKVDPSSS